MHGTSFVYARPNFAPNSKCYLMSTLQVQGRSNGNLTYCMNGSRLDKVTEEKDLGAWISNDLKVLQQYVQACSKANELLGVLNRTIKCKDENNLICFYKLLVRPHLEFCTAACMVSSLYQKQATNREGSAKIYTNDTSFKECCI